jgi:hypothetical protein
MPVAPLLLCELCVKLLLKFVQMFSQRMQSSHDAMLRRYSFASFA